jgi:exonuclease SbcC
MLLLQLPTDVAAFSVFNGHPSEEFQEAYAAFKRLYRDNNREWDERTLSFVICRTSELGEDDRFYATVEHDPLFCRKYVIRAASNVSEQRDELLRLPFLPLRLEGKDALQRPLSAQDYLQAAGISASMSRKLVEAGYRSAERIASDLSDRSESLPSDLSQPKASSISLVQPRAHIWLESLMVEGFRVYRDPQPFSLDASVVVLYGPNGLGKTSVFDAIDYASTGRIGRLCNSRRRSQTEFSQLATHLDKTPGSGSVELKGRSTGASPSVADWTLQRSTGNWTTAWFNGAQVDRKTVINNLTQANWPDSSPRQQTLESLFRATHLFGQDEQELLADFQRGSVIPEAFISEMLALQDYSQGLRKTTAVLAELSTRRSQLLDNIELLQAQYSEFTAALPVPDLIDTVLNSQSALEDSIARLDRHIETSGIKVTKPDKTSTVSTLSEWREVISARLRGTEDRLQLAQKLRNELFTYHRWLADIAAQRDKLHSLDDDIASVAGQKKVMLQNLESIGRSIADQEAIRRSREERRRALRTIVANQTKRAELLSETNACHAAIAHLRADITDLNGRISLIEARLLKARADSAAADQTLRAKQTDIATLKSVLDDSTQIDLDSQALEVARAELVKAKIALERAKEREAKASTHYFEIKSTREALTPAYERALAEQAELEGLLDSLELLVRDSTCPLCGTDFDSLERLTERIKKQRTAAASEGDTTVRYKALAVSESQASDSLRSTSSDVRQATEAIERLLAQQALLEEHLQVFKSRLSAFLDSPLAPAQSVQDSLRSRAVDLQGQRAAITATVDVLRGEIKTLEATASQEETKRKTSREELAVLEQKLKDLGDAISEVEVRLSAALPIGQSVAYDVANDIADLDHSIEETIGAIAELQSTKRGEDEALMQLDARERELSLAREQLVSVIADLQRSVSAFRQSLHRLDLPDSLEVELIDRSAEQEEQVVDKLRALVESVGPIIDALQAREARLQLVERQAQLEQLGLRISEGEEKLHQLERVSSSCEAIERLLKRERESAVTEHIAAYGPMITMIQQRLRSVYGFGGVHLEARGSQATVQVEWRKRSVQVPPTDFFSDSQRQILMLSIFLAGGLRQTWSGFAPVLLDDPVTHFDDLNAYAFVELLRGIISTSQYRWQFIISTCEERLFSLMQQKFSRLPTGSIFYEFVGMSEKGPIVVRQ